MKKIARALILPLCIISVYAFTTTDKWYLFESTAFGLKVEFPAKPIEKSKPINTEAGEITMHMIEFIPAKETPDANLEYLVSYSEYPADIDPDDKEKQKKLCRKTVDAIVTKLEGKLIKESIITLDGYEGVEARIEYKENTKVLKMRMYIVRNKMYMLETITLMAKDNNKSIQKFMDSFKLLK